MATEVEPDLKLEIAHVLTIDIVAYSTLLIHEQGRYMNALNHIVRNAPCSRAAEAEHKLTRLPTGDGMALVFFDEPEAPLQCAIEISEELKKSHPEICIRMGIHSGPISQIVDVNDHSNVAGAGIDVAQRVMDCGDAGHILLSKRVADDLEPYPRWHRHLYDLGECQVKHGRRINVFNFYTGDLGNPNVPNKLRTAQLGKQEPADADAARGSRWPTGVRIGALCLTATLLALVTWTVRRGVAKPPEKSVAVLPFENRSDEKATAYFADGIQDEILTRLSKIAALKVISRTSTRSLESAPRNLRDVGRELGVAHIVEGSVQKIGDTVRVNVQLIRAADDSHVWADTFDRKLTDIFSVESDIAKKIADELEAKISPSEAVAIEKAPTNDLVAYELYLHAQALFADTSDSIHARQKLPQAARLLDEAIERDPSFLRALCLLSRVHSVAYFRGHDHTAHRLDLAKDALDAAMRVQSESGEVHLALANYYYHGFRDYDRARTELTIARRTLPNNSDVFLYTAFIDRRQGLWNDATHNFEYALELDPRNFFILQQLALAYQRQRRYADQARIYDRALAIVPADPNSRILQALVALDWRADIRPFQATLAALVAEDPRVAPDIDFPLYALCERSEAAETRTLMNYPAEGVANSGVNFPHAFWEGVVARIQGDPARAQIAFTTARREVEKILEVQPDFAAAVGLLAVIDAGLGRKEDAIREGLRACELLPLSKDAIDGADVAVNLAHVYAWTGNKDRAIEKITEVERVPNALSYGLLKLHPFWDSLRGDPRFEEVVNSLAPK